MNQNHGTRPPTQSMLDEQQAEGEGMGQPQHVVPVKKKSADRNEAKVGGADATRDELVSLERQYWQALKDNDVEAAVALTEDPCIVAGAHGVMQVDKKAFRKMFEPETQIWQLKDFTLGETRVQMLSDDVAVLAYQVHEEVVVDGKPISLDANEASTWVRRDGTWRCAVHTEALAGDPFGRDRVATPQQKQAAPQR